MKNIREEYCEHCNEHKDTVEDILCNKCGKTCKIFCDKAHAYFNYGGLRATLIGVYGSRWDEYELSFDLCEECTAELIKSFSIPIKKEYVGVTQG